MKHRSQSAPASATNGCGSPAPRAPSRPDRAAVDALVRAALDEDRGPGDVTSRACVPAGARARARLLAKAPGRLAGIDVFLRTFELCDPAVVVEHRAQDGDVFARGDELARLVGSARSLLLAERTALNFVQRLSGIATRTAQYVERAAGRARILDTRKTTPGLRVLEKWAVACGGGENHRFGLFDEAMIKNNHVDLSAGGLADALRAVRAAVGPSVRVTAEARTRDEALVAAEGGADVVMLDNMSVQELARLCPEVRAAARAAGHVVEIEASGGIGLDDVDRVAACGVDRISVGALTHSAPALDLSLRLERVG